MDPELNLQQQLELAKAIVSEPATFDLSLAYRLAELVDQLRWWAKKNGARPKRYREVPAKVLPVLRAVLRAHDSDTGSGPKHPTTARMECLELATLIRSQYLEN